MIRIYEFCLQIMNGFLYYSAGLIKGFKQKIPFKFLKGKFENIEWEEVGFVDNLILYPCKSARGIRVSEAQATEFGLASGQLQDRSFLVVSLSGRMITGRQAGVLMTITFSYDGNFLTMTSVDGNSVRINLKDDVRPDYIIETRVWRQKVQGVDCGDEAAEWLSNILFNNQTEVRLIYRGDLVWERIANKPKYFEFPQFKSSDKLYFHDTTAFMIANHESLEDLNSRLQEQLTMENFRPNIVVKGPKAYDEDDWEYVKIGDVILRITKPCERCVIPCVDTNTGERKKEPTVTLLSYRYLIQPEPLAKIWLRSPIFGMNCGIDKKGALTVGQKVYVSKFAEKKWIINK